MILINSENLSISFLKMTKNNSGQKELKKKIAVIVAHPTMRTYTTELINPVMIKIKPVQYKNVASFL
ncbi:hypothetical protein GCM10009120_31180 [Sphingobacterium siyangense subsp. cladoniae]